MPVVADCYPEREAENLAIGKAPWPAPQNDGKTAVAALEDLDVLDYEWRVQNGWLLVRCGQWFWEANRRHAPTAEAEGGALRTLSSTMASTRTIL